MDAIYIIFNDNMKKCICGNLRGKKCASKTCGRCCKNTNCRIHQKNKKYKAKPCQTCNIVDLYDGLELNKIAYYLDNYILPEISNVIMVYLDPRKRCYECKHIENKNNNFYIYTCNDCHHDFCRKCSCPTTFITECDSKSCLGEAANSYIIFKPVSTKTYCSKCSKQFRNSYCYSEDSDDYYDYQDSSDDSDSYDGFDDSYSSHDPDNLTELYDPNDFYVTK